jgi:hypothetical protein
VFCFLVVRPRHPARSPGTAGPTWVSNVQRDLSPGIRLRQGYGGQAAGARRNFDRAERRPIRSVGHTDIKPFGWRRRDRR